MIKHRPLLDWERRIYKWAQDNRITQISEYRWDSNHWQLSWPPYLDSKAPLIRKFDLYVPMNSWTEFAEHGQANFIGISYAFCGHGCEGGLKTSKYTHRLEFTEEQLEESLSELKEFADELTEEDLVAWEAK